ILIQTGNLQWYVASVSMDGFVQPLLVSEPGDLATYQGQEFDEQVSFLRHRFCSILQRGCDRVWGRMQKPCQVIFIADGEFPQALPELSRRVATNVVDWVAKPPVISLIISDRTDDNLWGHAQILAGTISDDHQHLLAMHLPQIRDEQSHAERWERVIRPGG
ncbi:MAG: hypothetical protein KDA96_19790, partial [Planctomycetaceae bacterium]|nr:hypothetical protein [Planctomycetaceae bacterium]